MAQRVGCDHGVDDVVRSDGKGMVVAQRAFARAGRADLVEALTGHAFELDVGESHGQAGGDLEIDDRVSLPHVDLVIQAELGDPLRIVRKQAGCRKQVCLVSPGSEGRLAKKPPFLAA